MEKLRHRATKKHAQHRKTSNRDNQDLNPAIWCSLLSMQTAHPRIHSVPLYYSLLTIIIGVCTHRHTHTQPRPQSELSLPFLCAHKGADCGNLSLCLFGNNSLRKRTFGSCPCLGWPTCPSFPGTSPVLAQEVACPDCMFGYFFPLNTQGGIVTIQSCTPQTFIGHLIRGASAA